MARMPKQEIDPEIQKHLETTDPEVLKLEKTLAKKISNMVEIFEENPAEFDQRALTINKVARMILVEQLSKATDTRVVAVRERLRELNEG